MTNVFEVDGQWWFFLADRKFGPFDTEAMATTRYTEGLAYWDTAPVCHHNQ